MDDCLDWVTHTLGTNPAAARDSKAYLKDAEARFLSSLQKARETVVADGLEVLLSLQLQTIGDDPHYGLPSRRRRA